MSNLQDEILAEINQPFEGHSGYKIPHGHFEIGRKLHSESYFFVKRYFQYRDNCEKLSGMVLENLEQRFGTLSDITLAGFGNYTGLLLSMVCQKNPDFNYTIIENSSSSFVFQTEPVLKENVVIVLSVACTCSIYFKLKKFIKNYAKEKKTTVQVNTKFIVIFLIIDEGVAQLLDDDLKKISVLTKNPNTVEFYASYGWEKVSKKQLRLAGATAYPLIQLQSKLYLPEICPSCFPELARQPLAKEKYLFPTNAQYEAPSLIFDIPNRGDKSEKGRSFNEVMGLGSNGENPHLFGNIVINNKTYLNYIRGNTFYDNNKDAVIKFFRNELASKLKDKNEVVFITSDTRHSSTFLEDIVKEPVLQQKKVTILRYQPYHDFVDNFISIYSSLFTENAAVIYYEDVLSGGRTFKLISNYIKHLKTHQSNKTGFNLLLTLIDRTSDFSRSEIYQKLPHETGDQKNLIHFFRLNIPVVSAPHLGDPLREKHEMLKRLMSECHLDALKVMVGQDIQKNKPKTLAEMEEISTGQNTRQYIPLNKNESDAYEFYLHLFYRQKAHKVKLFLTHVINTEISQLNYTDNPSDLIESLLEKIKEPLDEIILDGKREILNPKMNLRKHEFEKDVLRNVITSVLSKPPFTDYEKIYKTVFRYVTWQLQELDRADQNDGRQKMDANEFIKLKTLIKRSVELNSSYIVSHQFLNGIKNDYWEMKIEKYTRFYKREYDNLANADQETREALRSNLEYKYKHLVTFNYFLLYCYKVLLFQNPGRSIRLESLINSKDLLPENSIKSDREEDDPQVLKKLWNSPYYLFIRILKAENIYLINELKELHKAQMRNRQEMKDEDQIYGEKPELFNLWNYYFKHRRNDIIINNARRLIKKSASKDDPEGLKNIQDSVCYMLKVMNILLHAGENKTEKAGNYETSKSKLNAEVRAILDAVLDILQPGIEKGRLQYAFFIEYREPQGDSYNLYPVISTASKDADNENFTIKMSKSGLIYNALYGLAETVDGVNPQTLMFAGKFPDGSIHSFQDYFYKAQETSPEHSGSGLGSDYFNRSEAELEESALSSEKLFRNDFWDAERETGLKMISESNMTLIFRLSNFVSPQKKEKSHKLKGQAVLVVTNTSETTYDNFIAFMNIEKIRLLLLIKEELLEYLQKQFDNDAFMEVLENRKQAIYQKKLQHGLTRYVEAQHIFFEDVLTNRAEQEIKKKKKLFEIVKRAINSQINFNTPVPADTGKYSLRDMQETMVYIFECGDLGKYEITVHEVELTGFDSDEKMTMHSSIPEVVIPELVINMKKYSSRKDSNRFLKVIYDKEKNQLVFENDIRESCRNVSDKKNFGGLEMCKWIMESLKYNNLTSGANAEGDKYTTIVDLNLKRDANKNTNS